LFNYSDLTVPFHHFFEIQFSSSLLAISRF